MSGGPCAEGQSFRIVAQEIHDRACDGLGVSPRHEYTAPVSEEFARIKIRRGDDGFAGANRIGQRPGRALLRLEVRRYIDVRGGEKLDEFTASNYDFFAPTTTNTIPPASTNPPNSGESGMVF